MVNQIPTVAILLATHNPSDYIIEQIESIKKQIGVEIRVYWGDYGSSEETKKCIRNLLSNVDFKEFEINKSGPAENFFELLKNANEEYIAFSDQDDIWLPNKLNDQVNLIKKSPSTPSLAHSTSQILKNKKIIKRKSLCAEHKFISLALSNCCQGCTLMINSKAQTLILDTLPVNIVWHDWWIGLLISAYGTIYYSTNCEVLYRIHNTNVIGIPGRFRKITNSIRRPSGLVSYQISQALNILKGSLMISNEEFALVHGLTSNSLKERLKSNFKVWQKSGSFSKDSMKRIYWTVRKP
jgi:glycosyltransferase involved in cell wall biosynthesis